MIAPNPLAPPSRRRSPLPLIAAVLAVLVIALGSWLLFRGDGNNSNNSNTPPQGNRPTNTSSSNVATAGGMVSFISTYANTLASDPAAAWAMLSPKFQAASGGLAKYSAFWDGVHEIRLSNVHADPSTMRISYHVKYSPPRPGKLKEDDVTLELVYENGKYLIDGEPTG